MKLKLFRMAGALLFVCVLSGQTSYRNGGLTGEGPTNYCGTDSGTGNAFVCADPAGSTIAAYRTGNFYTFKASHANSAAATLAIDGLTATTIKKQQGSVDLASGDIASGAVVLVQYDGTFFQLQTTLGNAAAGGGGAASCPIYTINYNGTTLAASTTSGATADITLFNLAQSSKVIGVTVKSATAFTSGTVSALTISVGSSTLPTFYTANQTYDVFAAVSATNKFDVGGQSSATDVAHNVIARFTPTNGALSALTAGQVKITVCTITPGTASTVQ